MNCQPCQSKIDFADQRSVHAYAYRAPSRSEAQLQCSAADVPLFVRYKIQSSHTCKAEQSMASTPVEGSRDRCILQSMVQHFLNMSWCLTGRMSIPCPLERTCGSVETTKAGLQEGWKSPSCGILGPCDMRSRYDCHWPACSTILLRLRECVVLTSYGGRLCDGEGGGCQASGLEIQNVARASVFRA